MASTPTGAPWSYIGQMEPDSPDPPDQAGHVQQWVQEIQRAVKTQFASLGANAVAVTAANLNALDGISASETVEARLGELEDKLVTAEPPASGVWKDFLDAWWNTVPSPQRLSYIGVGDKKDFTNAPFVCGQKAIDTGVGDQAIRVYIQRIEGASAANPAMQRITVFDDTLDFAFTYQRAANTLSLIGNEKWFRFTSARMVHTPNSQTGDIEETSVCFEGQALGCI